jgi:GlpG protein
MRQIGTIADEAEAKRLADYLLTLDVSTRVDPSSKGGFIIWARREEQVEQARKEYEEFRDNPSDPKYQGVEQAAKEIRKKAERLEKLHRKNTIDLRGRWAYRAPNRIPVTLILIALSVMTFVGMHVSPGSGAIEDRLRIASVHLAVNTAGEDEEGAQAVGPPQTRAGVPFQSDLRDDLRRGEVWRLITPIFLHFGYLHLLFNMMWLYDLGGMIEIRRGTLRLLGLVLVTAIASNLGQYGVTHYPFFGGMSGVVCGLFGFVWMRGKYEPDQGMHLDQNTVTFMVVYLAACTVGLVGRIANAAHLVGLAVGMLLGAWPHLRRALLRGR